MKRTALAGIVLLLNLLAVVLISTDCKRKDDGSATQKPLIGISTGLTPSQEGTPSANGVFMGSYRVNSTYIESIRQAGGIPVMLPNIRDRKTAEEILSALDGIVLTGGEDVDPEWYGEETIEEAHVGVNAQRDTSDILLCNVAVDLGKPILAICRGMQTLNVALGGTLYQDLPLQHPSDINHRQPEPSPIPTHSIRVEGDNFLSVLLKGMEKNGPIMVNTKHHQAVKDLSDKLVPSAWAEDGVLEAYCTPENSSLPTIIGVQFHPEAFVENGMKEYLPLFECLIENCR